MASSFILIGSGFAGLIIVSKIINFLNGLLSFRFPVTRFGFRGKLEYVDDGKHKVLLNHDLALSAKPDFIFKTGFKESTLVEYKSREKGIYPSDVAQMYIETLCARANGYPVKKGILATAKKNYAVDLSKNNRKLLNGVKKEISIVRNLKDGVLPQCSKDKNYAKCKNCGYLSICEKNEL